MAMANYDEWAHAVQLELKRLDLDAADAFEVYPFREAFENRMKPDEAVADFQVWLKAFSD